MIDLSWPNDHPHLAYPSQGHHPGATGEPAAAQHAADVRGEGSQAVVVPGLEKWAKLAKSGRERLDGNGMKFSMVNIWLIYG